MKGGKEGCKREDYASFEEQKEEDMKVEEVNLVINRTPCCTDVEIRRAVSGTRRPPSNDILRS